MSAVLAHAAVAQTYIGPVRAVPKTYFGMHVHKADSGTAWPRSAGIGTWRLWDARVIWPDIETQKGMRDFTRLDRFAAMAGILNVELVMGLGMTPTWASARPTEKAPYRPGAAAEPRDMQDWQDFVAAVAKRYTGRIRIYDVWNEVNAGTGFFTGTPQQMLELQRIAFEQVKAVDPQAILVSPSVVGSADHQLKWFDDYLGLGAGRYADVIGYHFYLPRLRPETLPALVARVREIMNRRGVGAKPLWNTESGYRVDLGQGDRAVATDPTWPKLDETTTAAYVARRLILGWVSGLERYYWYAWDNPEMGFVRPDGTLTPGASVFGRTAKWLTGAVLERCENNRGLWRCDLRRDQARARIVWHESASAEIDAGMPAGNLCRESVDGPSLPVVAGQRIAVGTMPALLRDCTVAWGTEP
ncbi:MAG: GH39 family glycosyl hydrolase [Burkholderiales bacterium]